MYLSFYWLFMLGCEIIKAGQRQGPSQKTGPTAFCREHASIHKSI